ncbi:MAG TPA: RsmD family RNA methyltransferase [Candidatus Binatia bacterium]|jgi:16S rRNA (guanine966-N2)-methyltransferase
MRVIGGTFGGRRLRAVEGRVTRPTSDRVREALFSRLEARYGLSGATILDVFAGTGALAIEAVSRGAFRAVCIELERRALDTLRGNVRELDIGRQIRVFADDYRRVLARLAAKAPGGSDPAPAPALPAQPPGRTFDGVFIDPPYGKGLALEALESVVQLALVKPGGWVTVEVGRRESLPPVVAGPMSLLTRVRDDVYGDTRLALYEAARPAARSGPAAEAPAAEVEQ